MSSPYGFIADGYLVTVYLVCLTPANDGLGDLKRAGVEGVDLGSREAGIRR